MTIEKRHLRCGSGRDRGNGQDAADLGLGFARQIRRGDDDVDEKGRHGDDGTCDSKS